MADCNTRLTDIGRGMLVGWSPGCGVDDPTTNGTLVYKKVGYLETRGESDTFRNVTANTEENGTDTDTRILGIDTELNLSFLDAKDATDVTTQQELRQYFRDEINAGREPSAWYRVTDPLLQEWRYYFCVPSSAGRTGENEGNRTGEITLTKTATNVSTNLAFQREDFPVAP